MFMFTGLSLKAAHGECGAQTYNGSLGAEPSAGSRGTAPGQGVRGQSPTEAERLVALSQLEQPANLP